MPLLLLALALFTLSARASAGPRPRAAEPPGAAEPGELSEAPEAPEASELPEANEKLELLAQMLSHIQHSYVEKVSTDQLLEAAIQGMLATLDPHTAWLTAQRFESLEAETRGEYGGLGLELSLRAAREGDAQLTRVVLLAPMEDSPAAAAGLRAGDLLLRVDGLSVDGLSMEELMSRLRGAPGSRVKLAVWREGRDGVDEKGRERALELNLLRARIKLLPVQGRLYAPYGYLRIKSFQEETDRALRRELENLRAQNGGSLAGLVLDLRGNPGGLFDQAVRVADRFLPGGLTIVTTRGRDGRVVGEERSRERGTEPELPMVLLVNGSSASASEILAGALQDHGRAVIMGSATFGKGSVQTLLGLSDGSVLKLTVARYFTPNGRSIQETGIVPDILLLESGAAEQGPRERDLPNHFKNGGPAVPTAEPAVVRLGEQGEAERLDDPALGAALDYLRTYKAPERTRTVHKASKRSVP